MKSISVPHGEIELSIFVEGDAAKPKLLLVHGFPLDHRMWSPIIPALAKDYFIIAPDLRGFGQTKLGEDVISMAGYAADLDVVLDFLEVDAKVFLAGLSMGGYIALEYWSKRRDRIAGMILCDTRSTADNENVAANRRKIAASVLKEGTWHVIEPMLAKLLSPETRTTHPAVVQTVQAIMMDVKDTSIAAAQNAMASRRDFSSLMPDVKCPVLCLVGADDELTPVDEMRAMAGTIDGASFVVIDHAGHLPPVENPDATASAIKNFIDSVAGI